jgi:histidine triad (HIT) family protein
MSCIFCKIIKEEIPAEVVFQDDDILVFKDVTPVAPTHLLFIPKLHLDSLTKGEDQPELMQKLLITIIKVAKRYDLSDYRVVTNIGPEGGQTVSHLHFHLLSGRQMRAMG